MKRRMMAGAVAIGVLTTATAARADGIDVVSYIARLGRQTDALGVVGIIAAAMLLNYLLNFVVIGLPAAKFGPSELGRIAKGLIALTLLGQVADRLGALAAVGAAAWLDRATEQHDVIFVIVGLLLTNIVVSGLAVGALAFYFVRRRWRTSRGASWGIAVAAGVFTNPFWGVLLLGWLGF